MTPKQRDALAYVAAYQQREGGVSPSYEEIAAALGLRSKSGVHALLHRLADQGVVSLTRGHRRSCRIVARWSSRRPHSWLPQTPMPPPSSVAGQPAT